MVAIGKPRGTRDFTPDEMRKRMATDREMRAVFERYGYREIATPTIENMNLFTMKSGKEIIEETYAFEDKSKRKLALRPELTAPAMRFYMEKLRMSPKPLKIYYFGNCFRYDRPQKGRYREFWQMGCELIGTDRPEAIAELIALAYHVLKETGLKDINLRIGHLDLLNRQVDGILSLFPPAGSAKSENKDKKDEIFRLIDKKDYDGVKNEFIASGVTKEKTTEFMDFLQSSNIQDVKKYSEESGLDQELKRYEEVISLLKEFGVNTIETAMEIARGLDYYKGIVFEIDAPSLGAEKQICGGGEYSLLPLLGGDNTPTAGFALGFDRIVLALEKEGYNFPPSKKPVYLHPIGDKMRKEAVSLARKLRGRGVLLDMDLMGRSPQKSLQYANRIGAKSVIIMGPDEWVRGMVTIKNMETGEQKEVKVEKLHKFL